MIDADDFLGPAKARGFDFYAGVPCSFLTPIINRVISDPAIQYVGAASEGEAVAIAAGAWLAGRNSAVMFQNSGLGNAVNPLTSLNQPFLIPALVITTWRGGPGIKDEPQHDLMGKITQALFDVMGIRHKPFPKDKAAVDGALDEATAAMAETGLPFAFVMEKGDVAVETLKRAIKVDDVQARRALTGELLGLRHRICVEHRGSREVALHEPHRHAIAQVDRRIELDHAATAPRSRTASSQRPSRSRPAALDFSGWNCTPMTDPWPAAATKRHPCSAVARTSSESAGSHA